MSLPDGSIPDDISEEQFADLISADLNGDERATDYLEQHVEEWFHGLQELFLGVEAQFAKRKADALTFQQRCLTENRSKREWFDYKAEYEQWRGRTNGFKRHVQARLSQVREMRRREPTQQDFGSLLREIIERLERIEKLVQS